MNTGRRYIVLHTSATYHDDGAEKRLEKLLNDFYGQGYELVTAWSFGAKHIAIMKLRESS